MERHALRAVWQPDLFGRAAEVGVAVDQSRERIELDATSWVEVVRGWFVGGDELFACLLSDVPWQQHRRRMFERVVLEPRLTAEIRDLLRLSHPGLRRAADGLWKQYGVRYDHLWLNLYRDGRDSTAWHGDRFSCRPSGASSRC